MELIPWYSGIVFTSISQGLGFESRDRFSDFFPKLVGTHALLIIITFIIKMYVYKMTCMILYPCSKHASFPSLPPPPSNVGIHMLLIHSQRTIFNNIDFGERGTEYLLQSAQQFRTRLYPAAEKN